MKLRSLFYYSLLFFLAASCSDNDNVAGIGDESSSSYTPTPYTFTEGFESGTKTAYAADSVSLYTGKWYLDDALIGNLDGDAKDDSYSIRLRTGTISMGFDVDSLNMICINHAAYGTDGFGTWQLLISTDRGATYEQLGNNITETSTSLTADTFSIFITQPVRFKIAAIDGTKKTRINFDDIVFSGAGKSGVTLGTTDPDDSSGDNSTSGRGIEAGDDAQPSSGDNSNLLLGNPSDAITSISSDTNYLINAQYYTESYNSLRGEPNWVSWHLDSNDITSAASRQDNFDALADLPDEWYKVTSTSYSGSGFNRGHNCPSGDRTSSVDANSATFLMTNMIPQAPNNNQQTWEEFESYIRTQVKSGKEAYIIMGSYGIGGTGENGYAETIDNGNITVPSYIWKVAIILPTGDNDINRIEADKATIIAINTPNENITDSWTDYTVSIDDLETATGYDLLSKLSESAQSTIESSTYAE